jgi:nicotinate-nucleotide pyrophosphorylase (carboxylating)
VKIELDRFIGPEQLLGLIHQARLEDMGPDHHDITSRQFVPPGKRAEARVCSRAAGRLCGGAMLPAIVQVYDPSLEIDRTLADGARIDAGGCLAVLRGSLQSILALERVALNLLGHLSGIATLTSHYVEAVRGSRARILDTRKTLPGLRGIQKYAVVCGGGGSHRRGLFDAVLLKDNHLAHVSPQELCETVAGAVARWRVAENAPAFIEVEVDDLNQLQALLGSGTDRVLLDNMTLAQLEEAVAMRNAEAPQVELEASGGVALATAGAIARTGVDFISVGALTHSAPSLDVGMDVE